MRREVKEAAAEIRRIAERRAARVVQDVQLGIVRGTDPVQVELEDAAELLFEDDDITFTDETRATTLEVGDNLVLVEMRDGGWVAIGKINDGDPELDPAIVTSLLSSVVVDGDAAGGDLAGTYPNPTIGANKVTAAKIAAATITDSEVAAANKDGANGTPGMRSLGLTTGKAMPGVTTLDGITAPIAAVAMNSQKITGLATPTASGDAATKGYVDGTTPAYVTSLPGSPTDGLEIFYGADPTNGVIWHLRYRSAASGSYKWDFLGGGFLSAEVNTSETTTSTSFADLTTVGPSITIPLAGDYIFIGSAKVEVASASNNSYLAALKIGSGAIVDDDAFVDFTLDNSTAGTRGTIQSRSIRRNVSAAATVCKIQYRTTNGAAVPTFRRRTLIAIPVRVG